METLASSLEQGPRNKHTTPWPRTSCRCRTRFWPSTSFSKHLHVQTAFQRNRKTIFASSDAIWSRQQECSWNCKQNQDMTREDYNSETTGLCFPSQSFHSCWGIFSFLWQLHPKVKWAQWTICRQEKVVDNSSTHWLFLDHRWPWRRPRSYSSGSFTKLPFTSSLSGYISDLRAPMAKEPILLLLTSFFSLSLAIDFYWQQDISMGSLFLAAKVEECPCRLSDLINVFDHLCKKFRRKALDPIQHSGQVNNKGPA